MRATRWLVQRRFVQSHLLQTFWTLVNIGINNMVNNSRTAAQMALSAVQFVHFRLYIQTELLETTLEVLRIVTGNTKTIDEGCRRGGVYCY